MSIMSLCNLQKFFFKVSQKYVEYLLPILFLNQLSVCILSFLFLFFFLSHSHCSAWITSVILESQDFFGLIPQHLQAHQKGLSPATRNGKNSIFWIYSLPVHLCGSFNLSIRWWTNYIRTSVPVKKLNGGFILKSLVSKFHLEYLYFGS